MLRFQQRIWFIVLLAFWLGFGRFAVPDVSAQIGQAEWSELRIDVWPEYDQPSVLVIYSATLDPAVPLPQTLRIPVPADAVVHAVAFPGETGGLFNLPWTSENIPSGQLLSFEVNTSQFVLEYYQDSISLPPARSFSLDIVLPYATANVEWALRQPSGASDLRTSPELLPAGLDALGNPQYGATLGPVEAGQTISLSVSYTKADEAPSISGVALVPPNSEVRVDGGLPTWLPALVGGIALGVVLAAVSALFWLGKRAARRETRQARRKQARATRGKSPRARSARGEKGAGESKFCPRCGRAFAVEDRFCRSCGAPRP